MTFVTTMPGYQDTHRTRQVKTLHLEGCSRTTHSNTAIKKISTEQAEEHLRKSKMFESLYRVCGTCNPGEAA